MRPYGSAFSVISAGHKQLDGWRGASEWGKGAENRVWFVTRDEYQERGSEYLKEHSLSNPHLTPPLTQTESVM